jgi:hypothetical protein
VRVGGHLVEVVIDGGYQVRQGGYKSRRFRRRKFAIELSDRLSARTGKPAPVYEIWQDNLEFVVYPESERIADHRANNVPTSG